MSEYRESEMWAENARVAAGHEDNLPVVYALLSIAAALRGLLPKEEDR